MLSRPGTPVRALEGMECWVAIVVRSRCGPRDLRLPQPNASTGRGLRHFRWAAGVITERRCKRRNSRQVAAILSGSGLDDLQEGRAIALELGVADAMNFPHGAQAFRPVGGELDQRAIRENDVGRDALRLRQF